jgi:DHA1 family multidrug resistance protein-like MFS transporter
MANILYSVLMIISMTFSVRASNNMLATTIPLLVKYNLGFNEILIGLISAVFSLSTFFMSGFVNANLKSKERRVLFIFSSIVYAALFPFFSIVNYVSIWILSIAIGFVLGALMPNIITSSSLYEDKKVRERIISIYTLTLSLSLIIGPAIESIILTKFTLRESFIFFAIFGFLAAITSFFIKFPEKESEKVSSGRRTPIFKNAGFRASVINNLIYNVPFAMITVFGGIYAKESFHVSYSIVTILFSLFFATSFLSRLIFTIKPPNNLSFQMIMSAILTALGLSILVLSNNIIIYAISFLILGIPHGLTYPLSLVALTRSFSPEQRNKANSYFFSVLTAIGTFIPILFGAVIELLGIRLTFAIIIPFVLIFLIFLRKEALRMKEEIS